MAARHDPEGRMSFLVSIPIPPSVNAMYGNNKRGRGRGRYPTKAYKEWQQAAGWEIKAADPEPIRGPYKLLLSLPGNVRGDPDNRIKPVNDLLKKMGLIVDDSAIYQRRCTAEVLDELRDFATVSVEAV